MYGLNVFGDTGEVNFDSNFPIYVLKEKITSTYDTTVSSSTHQYAAYPNPLNALLPSGVRTPFPGTCYVHWLHQHGLPSDPATGTICFFRMPVGSSLYFTEATSFDPTSNALLYSTQPTVEIAVIQLASQAAAPTADTGAVVYTESGEVSWHSEVTTVDILGNLNSTTFSTEWVSFSGIRFYRSDRNWAMGLYRDTSTSLVKRCLTVETLGRQPSTIAQPFVGLCANILT